VAYPTVRWTAGDAAVDRSVPTDGQLVLSGDLRASLRSSIHAVCTPAHLPMLAVVARYYCHRRPPGRKLIRSESDESTDHYLNVCFFNDDDDDDDHVNAATVGSDGQKLT